MELATRNSAIASTSAAAKLASEYTAICEGLNGFAPASFILEIQSVLRWLKIQPSSTEIGAIPYVVPAIVISILTFVLGIFRKYLYIVIPVLLVLAFVYYIKVIKPTESFVDIPSTEAPVAPVATAPPTGDQYTLINVQPAAIKQVGYVGPEVSGGKFDPVNGIINPMRAGVRFLTLQIDYLESQLDSSKFDDVGVPTLVYRNSNGIMMSTNGASISDIAKNIVNYSFNAQFSTSTQCLVLYLHFVRTPDYITAPDKYVKFLSAVAMALAPIQPMIAQGSGNTLFGRQQNEKILLYTPLQSFEKQIIVLCNVDTTIFRNAAQLGLPSVSPNQDLDSMVNMRVYLENENDSLGATTVASEKTPYAVVMPYKRLAKMSAKQRTTLAQKGKTRFVIAMPDQMSDPSQADISNILTTTGVNVIPINLLGQTYQDIAGSLSAWDGEPFYNIKPVALQSAQIATSPYGGPSFSPAAISPA